MDFAALTYAMKDCTGKSKRISDHLAEKIIDLSEFLRKLYFDYSAYEEGTTASKIWTNIARGLAIEIDPEFYDENVMDSWFFGLELKLGESASAFYELLQEASTVKEGIQLKDKKNKKKNGKGKCGGSGGGAGSSCAGSPKKVSKCNHVFAKLLANAKKQCNSPYHGESKWSMLGIVQLRFIFLILGISRKYIDNKTWDFKEGGVDDELKKDVEAFVKCCDDKAEIFAEFKVMVNTMYAMQHEPCKNMPMPPPLSEKELSHSIKCIKSLTQQDLDALAEAQKFFSNANSKLTELKTKVEKMADNDVMIETVDEAGETDEEFSEEEVKKGDIEEQEIDVEAYTDSEDVVEGEEESEAASAGNDSDTYSAEFYEDFVDEEVFLQLRRRQLTIPDFDIITTSSKFENMMDKNPGSSLPIPCTHVGYPAPTWHYRDWKRDGFKCVCGLKFRKMTFLEKHTAKGRELNLRKCEKCSYKSNRQCCMDKHIKEEHQTRSLQKSLRRLYACPWGCERLYWTKRALFQHASESGRACRFSNAVVEDNRITSVTAESMELLHELTSMDNPTINLIVKFFKEEEEKDAANNTTK